MENIKFTGFISEYNSEIANAMPYESYFKENGVEETYRHKVLDYLKSGILFSANMRGIEDLVSRESVGADAYYTDGKWIWPEYMIYYLEHNSYYVVENRFIQDLINRGFKYDKNSINEKKLNFFLSKHINGWWYAFKILKIRWPYIKYRLKSIFK